MNEGEIMEDKVVTKRVRLTEEENELVRQRMSIAGTLNFNYFAKALLLTGRFIWPDFTEMRKLAYLTNKISVNAGQLSKVANKSGNIHLQAVMTQISLKDEVVIQIVRRELHRRLNLISKVHKKQGL